MKQTLSSYRMGLSVAKQDNLRLCWSHEVGFFGCSHHSGLWSAESTNLLSSYEEYRMVAALCAAKFVELMLIAAGAGPENLRYESVQAMCNELFEE